MARTNSIQSMTGYGRAMRRTENGTVTVELRSTNHRYLEIDHRLGNGLAALQGRFAEVIRAQVRRGRIEATVFIQAVQGEQRRVTFDASLLQRYHAALVELKGRFGLKGHVTLDHLLALPQAVSIADEHVPAEQLWEPIRAATQAAAQELARARRREGAKLVADVRNQLRLIERHVRAVKRRLPGALQQQRARLRERLRELLGAGAALSTSQLEQAAAIVKESDIHEELVRVESHLGYMRQTLQGGALVGKRMDFIAQELMRETNTMGAKVNDPEAVQHTVDIKGCIEKIREQVQNLE